MGNSVKMANQVKPSEPSEPCASAETNTKFSRFDKKKAMKKNIV